MSLQGDEEDEFDGGSTVKPKGKERKRRSSLEGGIGSMGKGLGKGLGKGIGGVGGMLSLSRSLALSVSVSLRLWLWLWLWLSLTHALLSCCCQRALAKA